MPNTARPFILALAGLLLAVCVAPAGGEKQGPPLQSPRGGVGSKSSRGGPGPLACWSLLTPETLQKLIDIAAAKPFPQPDPAQFASNSRFGWGWMKSRFDVNHDSVITLKELGGVAKLFERLDRNHDGVVTSADLDWSQQNSQMNQGGGPGGGQRGPSGNSGRPFVPSDQFFRPIDTDENGRISREEWNKFFDNVTKLKVDFGRDDLRRAILQPLQQANDDRIRAQRFANLFNRRQGPGKLSLEPKPGLEAPNFVLPLHDGKGQIALSDYRGRQPVVLIFGSLT